MKSQSECSASSKGMCVKRAVDKADANMPPNFVEKY